MGKRRERKQFLSPNEHIDIKVRINYEKRRSLTWICRKMDILMGPCHRYITNNREIIFVDNIYMEAS